MALHSSHAAEAEDSLHFHLSEVTADHYVKLPLLRMSL